MADELVKSFLQRLNSVLLKEKEPFSVLEDQLERVVNKIREIAGSSDDSSSQNKDDDTSTLATELRDFINDVKKHKEKYVMEIDKQYGYDKTALSGSFRNEMQMIESCLAQTIHRMRQTTSPTEVQGEKEENNSHGIKEGETSAASSSSKSVSFESNYVNLPAELQNCLLYCCIFPDNYWIPKGKLIRLLVAEDLIKEKAERLMEDTAEENIYELVNQGMLQVVSEQGKGTKLQVPYLCREFCLHKIKEGGFRMSSSSLDYTIPQPARRVLTSSDLMEIDDLPLHSLFLIGNQKPFEERGNCLKSSGAKFLRVLDLENAKIKSLPDEVGDMIDLRYLGLKHTDLAELPTGLGKLIDLQTLDIRWCGKITGLPHEVLNLARLRHLKMFKNTGFCGVKLPEGIGTLRSLQTLTGINASGSIAKELGNLTQLRTLGVTCVAEEHISELFSSIMNMQGLLNLSLEAKKAYNQEKLVLLDSFSPPPYLRKLQLEGRLEKVPSFLGSMKRLTNIRLGFSHLTESPTLVLQLLPNLKTLTLWHANDAKQIGKEFCMTGGFPKLEVLSIASHVLEEWTDLEEGALPSLKYLNLHNCRQLRMLPEGLQFVTTLRQLQLLPLLDDHAERLKPDGGHENYKIRHIPKVSYITMSMLGHQATLNYTRCGVQIGRGGAKDEG